MNRCNYHSARALHTKLVIRIRIHATQASGRRLLLPLDRNWMLFQFRLAPCHQRSERVSLQAPPLPPGLLVHLAGSLCRFPSFGRQSTSRSMTLKGDTARQVAAARSLNCDTTTGWMNEAKLQSARLSRQLGAQLVWRQLDTEPASNLSLVGAELPE